MKKTLYSLMLSEDVVHEIDMLAHQMGTNRSNLINQILAEYVNVLTPEQRINRIFEAMDELMRPSRELVPFFSPNSFSMSMKSSLEYKYRPTVKYEVDLDRHADKEKETIGELSVVFRTQSRQLLQAMSDFFRIWKHIEDVDLAPMLNTEITYALYDGKFIRSLAWPNKDCTSDDIATAISDYIQTFDSMMKGYLAGRYSASDVERGYYRMLQTQKILL